MDYNYNAMRVPSPGSVTRVLAPEVPPKWWAPEAEAVYALPQSHRGNKDAHQDRQVLRPDDPDTQLV